MAMLRTVRLGEEDGGIGPRRPPLAHSVHKGTLHVAEQIKRLYSLMATVVDQNGFLVKTIVVGACAIIVAIVAWTLVTLMQNSANNSNRLTAIEVRLEIIQKEMERMSDD